MTILLDDLKKIAEIDRERMADKLEEIPSQYERAWQKAEKIKLPENYKNINQIIVCGMGASAIGGDLVKDFSKIPIFVNRSYNLPAFVDGKSLIILISYSGGTKEVLSCLEEAQKKRSKIFVITTGSQLLEKAENLKLPVYKIDYLSAPRLALPHLFLPLLKILENFDFLKTKINLKTAFSLLVCFGKKLNLTTSKKENFAKSLAYEIHSRIPIIIASAEFKEAARRWKTQFNENAKNFAFFEILPELKHNAVEGIDFPNAGKSKLFFLLLQTELNDRQSKESFELLEKFFKRNKVKSKKINVNDIGKSCGIKEEESLFFQKISLIHLGDWVSYYLAILNKTNPTLVKKINWFKGIEEKS